MVAASVAQGSWAEATLDEAPALRDLLKSGFWLPPSASTAERNWSAQGLIFSARRVRLDGDRGTKLVRIYWNLRALDRSNVLSTERPPAERALESFPVVDSSWEPFSNWGSSRSGDFTGMHGDEMAALESARGIVDPDEDDDGSDGGIDGVDPAEVLDWEDRAAHTVMPCPANILEDVKPGTPIVAWFGDGFDAWYVGTITRVDRRRKEKFVAEFDGGGAYLNLTMETYGVTGGKQWAVLARQAPDPIIVDASDDDEALMDALQDALESESAH